MAIIVQVCVLHTKRDYFDYLTEEGCDVTIGARVWVPFRQKTRLGVVIAKATQTTSKQPLKSVAAVIDTEPLLDSTMLQLCHWVAHYYQIELSEVIPLALPKNYRLGQACQQAQCSAYQLAIPVAEAERLIAKKASKQQALIHFLAQHNAPLSKTTLTQAGFTSQQIATLLTLNILTLISKTRFPALPAVPPDQPLVLNQEQQNAVETINQHLHRYQCFLLQGVTGSGKTEVYLQVIANVLAAKRQVLVLVPEIGLTPQLLARFAARFQVPIAVLHSQLNETERQMAWQLAKDNLVSLVIGTRTAVFTPLPSLGLIIIDEEHDASLKQMDGVRYSARDTALIRAYFAKIPIVLGSATPSLESMHNCLQDKYLGLRLTQKALTTTPLHYQILDIRNKPLQEGLAAETLEQIKTHLTQGNQVLVFINRRGFSPVLLCNQCGFIADCLACDAHLTFHRQASRLVCHHCGASQAIPTHCQQCHHTELIPLGVGTQRIHEYLATQFPNNPLLRIDRDETQKKHRFAHHLKRISEGEIQLIVGTQMLAKGHHFPRLTLVVILDTDMGFYNQDFRAIERLGQLLTQVAGRAGREQHAGHVLIQTYLPQHPLLNLLIQQGYDAFMQSLLKERQLATLPPYQFLALIRAEDKKTSKLFNFLHTLKNYLERQSLRVLGPAPAPLARKAKQHRMQLLIKSPSRKVLQNALTELRKWITINKLTNQVQWSLDVDPIDLS